MNKGYIYVLNELNEHTELLVLDDDFNMISKIEYNEKNASKILGVDDNVYVELDDKIYDLEKNIIYSRNEDISHMFMVAMKNENKLNLLYMGVQVRFVICMILVLHMNPCYLNKALATMEELYLVQIASLLKKRF